MVGKVTCLICRSADVRVMARLQPEHGTETYEAVACRSCGVVFSSPMPALSFEALQSFYGSEYVEDQSAMGGTKSSLTTLRQATGRQMDLVERHVARGVALNVGATSEAVKVIAERGWELRFVEASAYSAEKARRNWGFDVTTSRIEDFECPPGSLDFIKLGHVIEHLPDPGSVLRRLATMLRSGGVILVDTDNAHGLRTRIETGVRRLLGEDLSAGLVRRLTGKNLRKRYGTLGPPLHLYAFTGASLTKMMKDSGFEILEVMEPALGDPTWFPLTEGMRVSMAERALMQLCRIGAWFSAGDVVVALARKP
jgi:SAM-dependent methyltransferase